MNEMIKKLRQSGLAYCLIVALSGSATAQTIAVSNGKLQLLKVNYVNDDQQTGSTSDDERKEFFRMTQIVSAALLDGKADQAQTVAETLLKQAEMLKDDWNYGNAIHKAHLVLGQIALNAGDIDEAKRHLLESGKTPGSAQLDTFGPNMVLAKNLLEKKEQESVLKYFELCAKFWKDKDGKLNQWKAAVLNSEMPDFDKNLLY